MSTAAGAMELHDLVKLSSAQSIADIESELERLTRLSGFATYSAVMFKDTAERSVPILELANTPAAFAEMHCHTDTCKADPVLTHCTTRSIPFVWNQKTYAEAGAGPIWEEQAAFGYRNGIAAPLRVREGPAFAFGVDGPNQLPTHSGELQNLVAHIQLISVHAQDVMSRIALAGQAQIGPTDQGLAHTLSARELEVLKWAMEGKTAWETGEILQITERTVNKHAGAATMKLGCVNKQHAIVKAIRLQLIAV